jgi:5'-AMP-activated protein kinase regulatory gamma subunit
MLSVTDFIHILKKYHSNKKLNDLESHTISDWIDLLSYRHKDLVCIDPDESLLDAITRLRDHNIHRLLVADVTTGAMLYILTYRRILHFLCLLTYNLPQPKYMDESISELGIGTYKNIATIKMNTTVIEALDMLVEHRVSCLPVVDDSRRVLNLYGKADVINLVSNEAYMNLNKTVEEALEIQRENFEGLYICQKTDTLRSVMEWVIRMNLHRIFVANDDHVLIGVVSLSDIVNFLVLKYAPVTPDIQPGDESAEMELDLDEHL